jgi:hypothetical protein
MRYMIDPFPWLLMMVFQLDQEHKIAGSVVTTASDKGTDTAASTDDDAKAGYSTDGASKSVGPKGGRGTATSGDDSSGNKTTKAKVPAKGKPTKKPNKNAEDQKTKTIQMLKEQMKTMAEENQTKTKVEVHPDQKTSQLLKALKNEMSEMQARSLDAIKTMEDKIKALQDDITAQEDKNKALQDEIMAQEDKNKALQDEIMALKRDPQRPVEPEPEPALKPGREDQSPEPEVQP